MAREEDLVLALQDGETDAVLFQPPGDGKRPGVLYLTDIGGIRAAQRQAAQRLADEGYVVLMPNVFYRTAKPPVMDLAALRPNPESFMQRVRELAMPLTPEAQDRDAKEYVGYLSAFTSGKLGVVGFCICGGVAMRVAAACPEIVAAASFHGGNLFEDKPESPHLLLPRIKARLLFGHAENDRSMPAEAIVGFERALQDWGGRYESETYVGAHHGWTTLDNPAYNAPQAERAYQKLKELFTQAISEATIT
jgi:carboxymethylenebutenolidase